MADRVTYETRGGTIEDAGRDSDEVLRKRRRWDPLQPGTLLLAQICVKRDADGEVRIEEGAGGHRAVLLELAFVAKHGERGAGGRMPVRLRLVVGGDGDFYRQKMLDARGQIMRAASCYWHVDRRESEIGRHVVAADVDGMTVPIELGIERYRDRSGTQRQFQTATILSADPRSATYPRYLKLVRAAKPVRPLEWMMVQDAADEFARSVPSLMTYGVPGCMLYPGSPAHRLVSGRLAGKYARQGDEDDAEFALVDERASCAKVRKGVARQLVKRQDAQEDRSVARMAEAAAAEHGSFPKSDPVMPPMGDLSRIDPGVSRPVVNIIEAAARKKRRELRQEILDDEIARKMREGREDAQRRMAEVEERLKQRRDDVAVIFASVQRFARANDPDHEGELALERARADVRALESQMRALVGAAAGVNVGV